MAGVDVEGSGWTTPTDVVWIKGQLEEGSGTGYRHYQCLVALAKKGSLATVTRIFGRGIHAELSRSAAADSYVWKDETRIGERFEFGVKPILRNAKVDWERIWERAIVGDLLGIPGSIRVHSYRTLRQIEGDFRRGVSGEKTVSVFYGPTGTGKSRRAWHEAGMDAYPKCPRSKFWDCYNGESNVIIDEFRGGIDIAHLLRWLDRYPMRIEVKGSSRPYNVERVWITSNLPPEQWYPELDLATYRALERRFTRVIEMNESWEPEEAER